jgi:hypothetical protein
MDLWRTLLTAVLLAAALAGCRTAPYVSAHVESLNAEYRQLEDYVYCLEDENARLKQELEDVRENYERVRRGEAPARSSPYRPRMEDRGIGSGPTIEPPVIELPGNTPPRSILNKPPAVESPGKLDLTPPSVELPAPLTPRETSVPEPPRRPADARVTHISLNALLTGGTDLDGHPGDDGLSVVVEPRNARDEYVPEAGAVSIVVLDPNKTGEGARVARWDFDLSTTRQKLQAGGAARGIPLVMSWPATPPQASTLHLFVRYETPDGRRLQTDREIFLADAGTVSQRWTPRPPERQRPAEAQRTEVAQSATPSSAPTIKSPITAATPSAAPQLLAPPPALSGGENQPAPPAWAPFR